MTTDNHWWPLRNLKLPKVAMWGKPSNSVMGLTKEEYFWTNIYIYICINTQMHIDRDIIKAVIQI